MSADSIPTITCPSGLVAACAPLLGFTPDNCLVAFVVGVPGRDSPVLVRVDLPPPHRSDGCAEGVARSVVGTGGAGVHLVAWVADPDDAPRGSLRSERFLARLFDHLEDRGVAVLAAMSTNGRVWWSHDCPDALCCAGAQPLDADVLTATRAEFVFAGFAPLASREQLAERIARDPARAGAVARLFARTTAPARTERWRDAQIDFLTGLIGPHEATPRPDVGPGLPTARAARAIRALGDIVVRDVVLLRLIRRDPDADQAWQHTIDRLCDLVRCTPAGQGAAPATLLALVAWLRGEGALASVALDRAAAEDPSYRLALLTRAVIVRGTDPRIWCATMARLTEAECRRPRGLAGSRLGPDLRAAP